MNTWDKVKSVLITGMLRLASDAKLVVKSNGGTETTITSDEVRRKLSNSNSVETLIAAKTLTAAESGMTFFLGLVGGFTVTLPLPAAGLVFDFIVSVSPTTAYIIATSAGADIIVAEISESEVDTSDDGPYDVNGDVLTFVANVAVIGDRCRFISDGAMWYARGHTNADGGITTATT